MIERDPAFSGKVLRAANSAYYGGHRAPTVGRAISLLGMTTLRNLVVSVAYQQMTSNAGGSQLDRLALWRHSLAVALGCRIIGKLKVPIKAEELYVAGMLHDVGKLALDRFVGEDYKEAILLARQESIPLAEAEARVLGYSHCEIGAILANKWNLSAIIRSAIEYHHNPSSDGENFEATAIVSAANVIAHRAGFTEQSYAPTTDFDDSVLAWLELNEGQIAAVQDLVAKELASGQAAFKI